jgi:phage terminase large subunit-like protein
VIFGRSLVSGMALLSIAGRSNGSTSATLYGSPVSKSLVEVLAELPPAVRTERLQELNEAERIMLAGWGGQSRPEQREPIEQGWTYWALIGGRGSGKTRASAEWVCDRIEGIDSRTRTPSTEARAKHIGFIGRSAGDVRRVMVEGESGFVACAERRGWYVLYNPSRAQLTVRCPDGHEATITLFSAEEPESLRGPQHDTLWADEFAAWARKMDSVGNTAFTNAQAGLRLGDHPKGVFSTTPRMSPEIKAIFNDESGDWIRTGMTTWDNQANLAPSFIAVLRRQHPAGSRLAMQEFEGMLLEEVEGALWTLTSLDQTRLDASRPPPVLVQRAVAVDPSVQWQGQGSECGIIGGGLTEHQQLVATLDMSISKGPDEWAAQVGRACATLDTKTVIAEGNNGGALVSSVIRNYDPTLIIEIVFAKDGKRARAEPVAQLWDQLRAGIYGSLPGLEGQLTGWSSYENESPDRLDALAWLGHWAMKRMFYLPPGFAAAHDQHINATIGAKPLVTVGSMPGADGRGMTRAERLRALAAEGRTRRRRRARA